MSYGQTAVWHAAHTAKLKAFDKKFRGLQGPNLQLPLWSVSPRGGAYWTDAERSALREKLEQLSDSGPYYHDKSFWMFAELAWIHGRTSISIEGELKKVLGSRAFYERFPQI
jgi:hypothetical protein